MILKLRIALCLTAICLIVAPFAFAQSAMDPIAKLDPTEVRRTMPGATPVNQRYAEEYIDAFEVVGQPLILTPAQSTALAAELRTAPAFEPAPPESCTFRPGIAFRLGTGADVVDLLVCFACDEVTFVPLGQSRGDLLAMSQSTRDILLTTAKELLPDDEAIQELPAVRRDGTARPIPVTTPDAN